MTRPKRPRDPNQLAKLIVGIATGDVDEKGPDEGKDPAAVKRGRSGGLNGGQARTEALTAARRSEIAKEAARKRWSSK